MDNENGIVIAMSPVQMAAALSDKCVREGETMSNRLHGGLGLAGGVAEMFGAGAMCIVPEPTMLAKAGCVIVGTHGFDTIQAALRQVWSGRAEAILLSVILAKRPENYLHGWSDGPHCQPRTFFGSLRDAETLPHGFLITTVPGFRCGSDTFRLA